MAADVVKLAPLDAALIELAQADRDGHEDRAAAAITNVAWAWVRLDEREQASKLRYFRADRPIGASLRAALKMAATKHDLGAVASNYSEAMGRPWP